MAKHSMSDDDLVAYATGELSSIDMRLHLSHCTDCRTTVDRFEATLTRLHAARTRLVVPPAETRERARTLFRAVRPDLVAPAKPARLAPLHAILATLVFDSRQDHALAGLRAVADATRQLSYESGLADLDLQVAPLAAAETGERRWRLMGQLTTDEPLPGLTAELAPLPEIDDRLAGPSLTASLDEGGYFIVELPADRYALRIPLGDAVLRFPDLDLR